MHRHDGESDSDNFSKLKSAMTDIKMTGSDQESVFKMLAGILHLGNVSFLEKEGASDEAVFAPDSDRHVGYVDELLGMDGESLLSATTTRSIIIAGSVIDRKLTVAGLFFT
jgi:myosin heavy subunit